MQVHVYFVVVVDETYTEKIQNRRTSCQTGPEKARALFLNMIDRRKQIGR